MKRVWGAFEALFAPNCPDLIFKMYGYARCRNPFKSSYSISKEVYLNKMKFI